MVDKTIEKFQQEILKNIKLKNTSIDIHYQQNTYYSFKSSHETPSSVSLNLAWQKIFLLYRSKSEIDDIGEMSPNFNLSERGRDNVYIYDVNTLDFAQACAVFIKLVEHTEQYLSRRPVINSRKRKMVSSDCTDTSRSRITVPDNLRNCHFRFLGRGGNEVVIHPNADLRNVFLEFLGKDSKVYIGENVSAQGQRCLGVGRTINISSKTTSTSPVYITVAEHTTLSTGRDCILTINNQIRTDGAHPIYDVHAGKRLNVSKDVTVRGRVWVACSVTIRGGTKIGNGSIIGAFSIVKKRFPNNYVIAGVPTKVICKDVFRKRNNVLHTDIDEDEGLAEINHVTYINSTIELN